MVLMEELTMCAAVQWGLGSRARNPKPVTNRNQTALKDQDTPVQNLLVLAFDIPIVLRHPCTL